MTRSGPGSTSDRGRCDTRSGDLLTAARAAGSGADRKRLQQAVVLLNRPLALGLARRFGSRGLEQEDLDQVAMVGLCKAVRGYRHGPPFSAYAVPTILGELKRHFRDRGWLVRPSRTDQELGIHVRAVSPVLAQELGRAPTRTELASSVGCSPARLEQTIIAQEGFRGTSIGVSGDESPATPDVVDPRDGCAVVDDRITIARLMARLGDRDRLILRLRYHDELTQQQIGSVVGLSQMQVSRILADTVSRLRGWLTED